MITWLKIAIVAAVFFVGWTANGWRLNAKIDRIQAQYASAAAKAEEDYRAKEHQWQTQKDEAINEANQRAQQNAIAANSARSAANSLRDQLASARSDLSRATEQAARNYAATLSDVFGQCVEEYRGLAEKADGAISDIRTLEDSWPIKQHLE
jgi:F0F1-type ATP synthase membrane subunit b/b'